MKKIAMTLVALALCAAGLQAQQKKVVKEQGAHPREVVTSKGATGGAQGKTQTRAVNASVSIDTTAIQCWAGHVVDSKYKQ
jgi:hypothetical protein